MNMTILAEIFLVLSCPECHDTKSLQLHDVCEKKRCLARYLQLKCSSCLYVTEFCTSKTVQRKQRGKGRNMYEINIPSVYGFRQIGSGYHHLKKLCCILDMLEPMRADNYRNISNSLQESAKLVAENSMASAAVAQMRLLMLEYPSTVPGRGRDIRP